MGLLHRSTRGDKRILIQRSKIQIQCAKDPSNTWNGYLVMNERGQENIFFFSSKKLTRSEGLILVLGPEPEDKIKVSVQSCHDQVSSGRVMRMDNTNKDNPFSAKFYFRCYASIDGAAVAIKPTAVEDEVINSENNEPESATDAGQETDQQEAQAA